MFRYVRFSLVFLTLTLSLVGKLVGADNLNHSGNGSTYHKAKLCSMTTLLRAYLLRSGESPKIVRVFPSPSGENLLVELNFEGNIKILEFDTETVMSTCLHSSTPVNSEHMTLTHFKPRKVWNLSFGLGNGRWYSGPEGSWIWLGDNGLGKPVAVICTSGRCYISAETRASELKDRILIFLDSVHQQNCEGQLLGVFLGIDPEEFSRSYLYILKVNTSVKPELNLYVKLDLPPQKFKPLTSHSIALRAVPPLLIFPINERDLMSVKPIGLINAIGFRFRNGLAKLGFPEGTCRYLEMYNLYGYPIAYCPSSNRSYILLRDLSSLLLDTISESTISVRWLTLEGKALCTIQNYLVILNEGQSQRGDESVNRGYLKKVKNLKLVKFDSQRVEERGVWEIEGEPEVLKLAERDLRASVTPMTCFELNGNLFVLFSDTFIVAPVH